MIKRVDNLKRLVGEKASIVDKLESEYEDMNHTINSYLEMNKDQESRSKVKDVKVEKNDKDCLVFHGVMLDDMERMTADEDISRNFLDHNIKKLLQAEWDIECTAPFKHVFRFNITLITLIITFQAFGNNIGSKLESLPEVCNVN